MNKGLINIDGEWVGLWPF